MRLIADSFYIARQWLEQRPAADFALRWICASVAGWSAGLYLGSVGLALVGGFVGLLLAGAICGLVAGTAQLLVLRAAGVDKRWIFLSTAGGALAVMPVILAGFTLVAGRSVGVAVMGAVFGLCFGLVQTSALRHLQDMAIVWVLANILGGGLCGALSLAGSMFMLPICLTPGPLVFGIITGSTLWWMIRAGEED
jgi:hypothetical protein